MLQKIALVLSLMVVLGVAGTASAGNGGGSNKSSSSISAPIVVSSGTASPATTAATTTPHYGDTVTFDVSTTATDQPFVNVVCYQNGALALNSWAAFWSNNGTFALSSGLWTGGASDCTANLGMYVTGAKYKVLASSNFHVDA